MSRTTKENTATPSSSIPSTKITTLRARLDAMTHDVNLMRAAVLADATDDGDVEALDILEALSDPLTRVIDELWWVRRALTDAILDSEAPTDDDRLARGERL